MFRYKHVHHYIQEKNIKCLLLLKNEKNISEHDYTCIHLSYKDIAQTYNLCMTFCGHGECSTTHANLCDELDIVFDEGCHDFKYHSHSLKTLTFQFTMYEEFIQ